MPGLKLHAWDAKIMKLLMSQRTHEMGTHIIYSVVKLWGLKTGMNKLTTERVPLALIWKTQEPFHQPGTAGSETC